MCGICVTVNGERHEVTRMGKALQHRGTKNYITEIDNVRVWFSHLPITDPDAHNQPFVAGPWMVWLNGYISNYKELSIKHGIDLETNCDTELLAKYIEKKGPYYTELNGFFSIVTYNTITKRLDAITDRYGVKQLYTYARAGVTYIASEVKSLLAVLPLQISEGGAEDWLYSLGVMNDDTIYSGVKRVESVPFNRTPNQISISYDQAKDQLQYLLQQSVQRNKVNGLTNGVFLSGGVDSGILADRMSPDYCFSMDYVFEKFSEIENIKHNSRGIHYTMICNGELFESYKYKTATALDDLKAGSCYTNYALTELASKFCTVLYSGAGSDEIFNGYVHRYDKPIEQVIKRTAFTDPGGEYVHDYPAITHKQYDWKFLKAILVVEDRMAGFHTMETRYPFLDNDLVDFVLSLPPEYKVNKQILKEISGLSPEVTEGKKRGFSNPYMSNYQWAKFVLDQKMKP